MASFVVLSCCHERLKKLHANKSFKCRRRNLCDLNIPFQILGSLKRIRTMTFHAVRTNYLSKNLQEGTLKTWAHATGSDYDQVLWETKTKQMV